MSRVCCVCGKSKMAGNTVSHSKRRATRTYSANVQKVKMKTATGGSAYGYVCTRCLRSGKVERV